MIDIQCLEFSDTILNNWHSYFEMNSKIEIHKLSFVFL